MGDQANLEKAIDIKRRAQRCVQNGDLDGAVREYEKLLDGPDPDPYHYVLLADLLHKRGTIAAASERYLEAVQAYQSAGLFKNAIAVCKKMSRLGLSPTTVLMHLAELHLADGLMGEASLYFTQFADHQVRAGNLPAAANALRRAFDTSPEHVVLLEQYAEVLSQTEDAPQAAMAFQEAAACWRRRGHAAEAERCAERALRLDPESKPFEESATNRSTVESGNASPFERTSLASPSPTPESGLPPRDPALESHVAPQGAPLQPVADDDLEIARPFTVSTSEDVETPLGVRLSEQELGGEVSAPESPTQEPVAEQPTSTDDASESRPGVEQTLHRAQQAHSAGQGEESARLLADAAAQYEQLGRDESAAALYRRLARGTQMTVALLERWLSNCDRRGDRAEAAIVACDLGDHAIQAGDLETATRWFSQAAVLDPANDTARRRLDRLRGHQPESTPLDAGRVAVSLGRNSALSLDLEGLLGEFQRGVAAQMEGDAQGHYDLGMAYREMGLTDQAIEAFRIAQQDARLTGRACEMIGRCLLDAGRAAEATVEFEQALRRSRLDEAGEAELRVQLALALSTAGDLGGAIAQLEIADQRQPGRADIAEKLAEWRREFGQAA